MADGFMKDYIGKILNPLENTQLPKNNWEVLPADIKLTLVAKNYSPEETKIIDNLRNNVNNLSKWKNFIKTLVNDPKINKTQLTNYLQNNILSKKKIINSDLDTWDVREKIGNKEEIVNKVEKISPIKKAVQTLRNKQNDEAFKNINTQNFEKYKAEKVTKFAKDFDSLKKYDITDEEVTLYLKYRYITENQVKDFTQKFQTETRSILASLGTEKNPDKKAELSKKLTELERQYEAESKPVKKQVESFNTVSLNLGINETIKVPEFKDFGSTLSKGNIDNAEMFGSVRSLSKITTNEGFKELKTENKDIKDFIANGTWLSTGGNKAVPETETKDIFGEKDEKSSTGDALYNTIAKNPPNKENVKRCFDAFVDQEHDEKKWGKSNLERAKDLIMYCYTDKNENNLKNPNDVKEALRSLFDDYWKSKQRFLENTKNQKYINLLNGISNIVINLAHKTTAEQKKPLITEQTNQVIREKSVQTMFTNISQYFESRWPDQEQLAQQFMVDTKNGISFKDDGKINMKWYIEGKEVNFEYNPVNGAMRVDTLVSKDPPPLNVIHFSKSGDWKNRVDVGINIGKLADMQTLATTQTQNNIDTALQNTTELKDFRNNLSAKTTVDFRRNKTDEDKQRIQLAKEKNLAMQEVRDAFHDMLPEPTDKIINNNNPKLYRLRWMFTDTINNRQHSDELHSFRTNIAHFKDLLNNKKIWSKNAN